MCITMETRRVFARDVIAAILLSGQAQTAVPPTDFMNILNAYENKLILMFDSTHFISAVQKNCTVNPAYGGGGGGDL